MPPVLEDLSFQVWETWNHVLTQTQLEGELWKQWSLVVIPKPVLNHVSALLPFEVHYQQFSYVSGSQQEISTISSFCVHDVLHCITQWSYNEGMFIRR